MTLSSMTGFARAEGRRGETGWVWELRSVNSRGLDLRCRIPTGFDALEIKVREAVAARFKRGAVSVNLQATRERGAGRFTVDQEALDRILTLQQSLGDRVDQAPPRIEGLLAIRGVVETVEEDGEDEDSEALRAAMAESFGDALDALAEARSSEGAQLESVLEAHLGRIGSLAAEARETAAAQPAAIRDRLLEQVAAISEAQTGLSEERMAQEVALLAAKADVREELDRLSAHVNAAAELLGETGAVGRRLDFLCQEFNREANTICSKSAGIELTRIGLEIKATIEQFREQVQNIE